MYSLDYARRLIKDGFVIDKTPDPLLASFVPVPAAAATRKRRARTQAPQAEVCQFFIHGTCRFGRYCNKRHERPVCRYFQILAVRPPPSPRPSPLEASVPAKRRRALAALARATGSESKAWTRLEDPALASLKTFCKGG